MVVWDAAASMGRKVIENPAHELATNDGIVALNWIPGSPECIAAGTCFKFLRLFDLRASERQAIRGVVAHREKVNGVEFDPFNSDHVATFDDTGGIVKVWDLKMLTIPVATVQTGSKTLTEIGWCPHRSGLIATVGGDHSLIKVWDVAGSLATAALDAGGEQQQKGEAATGAVGAGGASPEAAAATAAAGGSAAAMQQDPASAPSGAPSSSSSSSLSSSSAAAAAVVNASSSSSSSSSASSSTSSSAAVAAAAVPRNSIVISSPLQVHTAQEAVSSFQWHPADPHSLVLVDTSGEVEVLSVYEPIPIAWSPVGVLASSTGTAIEETPLEGATHLLQRSVDLDISELMRLRARAGLRLDPATNMAILQGGAGEDPALVAAWSWLQQEQRRRAPTSGVFAALGMEVQEAAVAAAARFAASTGQRDPEIGVMVYRSAQRSEAMAIAGWAESPEALEEVLTRLEAANQYERAAALAFWQSNVERCIAALTRGTSRRTGASSSDDGPRSLLPDAADLANSASGSGTGSGSGSGAAGGLERSAGGVVAAEGGDGGSGSAAASSSAATAGSSAPSSGGGAGGVAEQASSGAATTGPSAGAAAASSASSSGSTPSAASDSLSLLALGLAGYRPDRQNVLNPILATLRTHFAHPYLRNLIHFLSSPGSIDEMLEDPQLALADRVGLALRYLRDDELVRFIHRKTTEVTRTGNPEGIVLTGLTPILGLSMLSAYVDRTSDVQSAALLLACASPRLADRKVEALMDNYRELLNVWRLWHERAHLDVALAKAAGRAPAPAQVSVRCNFCSGAVSWNASTKAKPGAGGSALGFLDKSSACPACNKPLPRCAVCQQQLGTPREKEAPQAGAGGGSGAGGSGAGAGAGGGQGAGSAGAAAGAAASATAAAGSAGASASAASAASGAASGAAPAVVAAPLTSSLPTHPIFEGIGGPSDPRRVLMTSDKFWNPSSTGFGHWFAWCQTCRHGGHAAHIFEWFETRATCPVADCTCRCRSQESW